MSCVAYWPLFYTPNCSCSNKGLVPGKVLSREIWERFQLIEMSSVWQPNLVISHAKSGWKRVVKEMMAGSSYRFPFSLAANFSHASHFRVFPTLSRLPHYWRAWNRLLSASLQSMASARTIFYKTFIVHTRIAALHAATVKLRDMMLFKNIRHYLFIRFLSNTAMKRWASYPSLILSYLHREASWWPDNKIVQDSREIDSCMRLVKQKKSSLLNNWKNKDTMS